MIDAQERYQPTETILIIRETEGKMSRSMPITISEDSDDEIMIFKRDRSNRPQRCMSLPVNLNKSIMIRKTLGDSLHCKYGSEDDVGVRLRKNLSLQFDKINIREYSGTVGDNPSCSNGPPISISWEYNIIGDIDLDEYERTRPPRRVQNEMILPRTAREDALRYEWNVCRKDIIESVRQNVRIKNQRRTTINNLGKATMFEEAMESASRKFKRLVKGQKAIHKQVRDLETQIEVTNRRRSKLIYLEQKMSQDGEESAPTLNPSLALSESCGDSENSVNVR